MVLTLIIMGGLAIFKIPKESMPSPDLGSIAITTVYPGSSPIDMDSLVTDKIYKEIKDISGIDTITSNSSLGLSNIMVTLEIGANTKDIINDIRNRIGRVVLPSDAKTPTITELKINKNQTFSVFLYPKNEATSKALLFSQAIELQKLIE